jgi:uncharacterized protein DUF2380
VTLWALLLASCGTTVAQSVAVFDFELIDTSLEGAIRGVRPDELERLARLSDQFRQLSATSRAGAMTPAQPGGTTSKRSRSSGLGVLLIVLVATRV